MYTEGKALNFDVLRDAALKHDPHEDGALLEQTIAACHHRFSELRIALATRMTPVLARAARAMTGALRRIGAERASCQSAMIEGEAVAERWSQADLGIEPLAAALGELRAAVTTYRANG
jgi:HPt (histidine-containing phosphotransfer) domain-containing protein